jgi:hypothetical protein
MLRTKVGEVPPALAVRIAVWAAVTAPTEAVKDTLEAPAGTVIVAGTLTLVLLLESATLVPPAGAAPVKIAVHVEEPPALTVDGEQVSEPDCTTIVKAIEVDWVTPFREPLTVTFWAVVTVAVVAVNVALLWLTATVILAGTDNTPLLVLKVTRLAVRAALFRETVHWVEELLPKVEGEQVRDEICAGAVPVSVNVWDVPLNDAVNSAVWLELIAETVAVKEELFCPALTPTVGGTVMLALLLDRVILAPPAGAGPLSVTVHTEDPGAVTLEGVQVRLVSLGAVGCEIPMAPLVADEGITLPYMSVATTPVIWMGARVSSVPALIPNAVVARTPSLTVLVFTPKRMQIVLPLLLAQVIVLPAAFALAPATTLTVPISATG